MAAAAIIIAFLVLGSGVIFVAFSGGPARAREAYLTRGNRFFKIVLPLIYLGIGIQSNQARMLREGGFFPGHGLDRIVAYHERQDARFAQAAADIADATGKPILTATELAVAWPDNPGPATVRATGRLCYSSANRAVTALGHLWRYARFRRSRGYA